MSKGVHIVKDDFDDKVEISVHDYGILVVPSGITGRFIFSGERARKLRKTIKRAEKDYRKMRQSVYTR